MDVFHLYSIFAILLMMIQISYRVEGRRWESVLLKKNKKNKVLYSKRSYGNLPSMHFYDTAIYYMGCLWTAVSSKITYHWKVVLNPIVSSISDHLSFALCIWCILFQLVGDHRADIMMRLHLSYGWMDLRQTNWMVVLMPTLVSQSVCLITDINLNKQGSQTSMVKTSMWWLSNCFSSVILRFWSTALTEMSSWHLVICAFGDSI